MLEIPLPESVLATEVLLVAGLESLWLDPGNASDAMAELVVLVDQADTSCLLGVSDVLRSLSTGVLSAIDSCVEFDEAGSVLALA